MADRLTFKFMRTGKFVEMGELTVDVNDPTNQEEIEEKLRSLKFASYVVQVRDTDDESWNFALPEDVDTGA